MKKFLSGFLAGVILCCTFGVLAASYVAETAGFKVFVNGQEFTSDPTPVVIEGRTFLPLRAMGDALGVAVEWNEESRQVEVGNPPVPQGYSRNNPAPIGTAQALEGAYGNGDGTMEITVTEVITGTEAAERVAAANFLNPVAGEGYEYILVKVKMAAKEVTRGKELMLLDGRFKAYSDDNVNPDNGTVVSPKPNIYSTQTVGMEQETEGFLVLQIKQGDTQPKLVYDFANNGGIWFKLY